MSTKLKENEEGKEEVKPKDLKERQYILHFMYKNRRAEPTFKVFNFIGPLEKAIVEGRNHCEFMNLRFLSVRPFVVDLKEQERLKLSNPDYEPEG